MKLQIFFWKKWLISFWVLNEMTDILLNEITNIFLKKMTDIVLSSEWNDWWKHCLFILSVPLREKQWTAAFFNHQEGFLLNCYYHFYEHLWTVLWSVSWWTRYMWYDSTYTVQDVDTQDHSPLTNSVHSHIKNHTFDSYVHTSY